MPWWGVALVVVASGAIGAAAMAYYIGKGMRG